MVVRGEKITLRQSLGKPLDSITSHRESQDQTLGKQTDMLLKTTYNSAECQGHRTIFKKL
jgi:hypothetical protein